MLKISTCDELYSISTQQGIAAIVWDKVLQTVSENNSLPEYLLSRPLKIQWALAVENIIKQYIRRKQLSIEIADVWARAGIKTYSLKGWALSTYYPKPELREFGDFDCWVGSDFNRSNQIAIDNGAQFDPHDYRHSHIYYKGLTIENHQYFLPIRGNARKKRLERYLQAVIPYNRRIEDSNIYYPSPQFHSLFIVLHMLQHFLYENITLRHMLDWAYFVNAEKDNIDWREFNLKCTEAGATRFVEALNHICTAHMGLNLDGTLLNADCRYAEKILQNTLDQSSQKVSGVQGIWLTRLMKIQNITAQRWRFNELYDRNFIYHITQTALGIIFDRNPHM